MGRQGGEAQGLRGVFVCSVELDCPSSARPRLVLEASRQLGLHVASSSRPKSATQAAGGAGEHVNRGKVED